MKASFHICGTTLHARQYNPSHLLPTTSFASVRTKPSRTICGCIIGSFPDRRLATTRVIDLGVVLRLLLLQRQRSRSLWKGRQLESRRRQGATRDNRRCHSWKSVFKR